MTTERSDKEWVRIVLEKALEIPTSSVYFSLKEYGMKNIRVPTVELTKKCLALHFVGIPITLAFLEYIHNPSNIYSLLHRLGDYKVLTIVKDRKRRLRFVVNPLYLRRIRLPKGIEEV